MSAEDQPFTINKKKTMSKIIISGETPFKVLKEQAIIGPSEGGYTLAYSATRDGEYTEYTDPTPAGENLIINGLVPFSYLKLVGNTGEVEAVL